MELSTHVDQATNTDDGEDFEAKCQTLIEELENVRKQHLINREEFQRELERVDSRNIQLEKDLKSAQERLTRYEKRENEREKELTNLTTALSEQQTMNDTLSLRVTKLEQTNRSLTQRLTKSEDSYSEIQSQCEEYQRTIAQTDEKYSNLQRDYKTKDEQIDKFQQEVQDLKEKIRLEISKGQEIHEDNDELRESMKYLQEQLQEKIIQEQHHLRERQQNSNFKDFIQVKRNLQVCQQENEQLKVELKKLQIKFVNK